MSKLWSILIDSHFYFKSIANGGLCHEHLNCCPTTAILTTDLSTKHFKYLEYAASETYCQQETLKRCCSERNAERKQTRAIVNLLKQRGQKGNGNYVWLTKSERSIIVHFRQGQTTSYIMGQNHCLCTKSRTCGS